MPSTPAMNRLQPNEIFRAIDLQNQAFRTAPHRISPCPISTSGRRSLRNQRRLPNQSKSTSVRDPDLPNQSKSTSVRDPPVRDPPNQRRSGIRESTSVRDRKSTSVRDPKESTSVRDRNDVGQGSQINVGQGSNQRRSGIPASVRDPDPIGSSSRCASEPGLGKSMVGV